MGSVKIVATMNNLAKSGDQALSEVLATLGGDNPQAANVVRDAEGKVIRVEVHVLENAAERAAAAINGNTGVAVATPPIPQHKLVSDMTNIVSSRDFSALSDGSNFHLESRTTPYNGLGGARLGDLNGLETDSPVYVDYAADIGGGIFGFLLLHRDPNPTPGQDIRVRAGDKFTFTADGSSFDVTATRTYLDLSNGAMTLIIMVDKDNRGWISAYGDGITQLIPQLHAYDDVVARGERF